MKVISNEFVDFDDPKEFNDPQVFDDPKGISIGSMDFDNPKVYSDTLFPIESVRDEIFDFFSTKGTMRWRLVQATALPS